MDAARAELLRSSRHEVEIAHRAARRARASSRTSTRCSPTIRPTASTGCSCRRRRRAAARLPRPLPARRRARRAEARPARAPRCTRTPRGRSRAAAPGVTARETTFVEIGPRHRVPPRHVRRRCCRSRTCAWAGASTPTGPRVAREHGWPIGIVDATPVGHTLAPGRRALRARRGDRRGARVPRRAPVRARATRSPHAVQVRTGEGRGRRREFYPRAHDPVLGVWAHRQALAARDAGADVRVLVLLPPVPPLVDAAARAARARRGASLRQPRARELDGIDVELRPLRRRRRARGRTGRGARGRRRRSRRALRRLRRRFPFDLVHAHNAVPAGDAVLRARTGAPLVVSVHGGDVLPSPRRRAARPRGGDGARSARARLVLANSAGIERRCRGRSARARRASCTSAPTCRRPGVAAAGRPPTLVTVAPPRRAQAPRRRAARAGAAARPPSRAALRRRSATAPSAAPLERLAARARRRRTASSSPGSSRTPEALRRARGGRGVRAAERGRGVRRRLRRGDGGRAARDRLRAASPGPEEIARGRRRHPARRARRPRALARRDRRAARRPRRAARGSARRAGDGRGRVHLGALRGRDRRAPTRTRCGDRPARPVRHQPRAARPRRRVRGAARAHGDRARAVRRPRPPRHGRRRRPRRAAPPRHASARSHALAASGRYRAVVAGTAGRTALPAAWLGARRARVPFVLWSALWAQLRTPGPPRGAPAHGRASTATPTRSSPTGRTSRRSPAPTAPGGSRSRRSRSTTRFWSAPADAPERRGRRSRSCSSGATRPRRASRELLAAWRAAGLDRREAVLVLAGEGHEAARGVPGVQVVGALDAPESAQLLCRRRRCGHTVDPLARASWSRGGSSPTRP